MILANTVKTLAHNPNPFSQIMIPGQWNLGVVFQDHRLVAQLFYKSNIDDITSMHAYKKFKWQVIHDVFKAVPNHDWLCKIIYVERQIMAIHSYVHQMLKVNDPVVFEL